MRFPIASSIESRDGSLAKDAKLVNCFVDVEGETSFVVKRPGLRKSVASAAGSGLGMVSWEGNMYHAVGSTFYQTDYASIPSGGSNAPSATAAKQWDDWTYAISQLVTNGSTLISSYGSSGSFETYASANGGVSWTKTDGSGSNFATGRLVYGLGKLWWFGSNYVTWSSDGGVTWQDNSPTPVPELASIGPVFFDGSKFITIKLTGTSQGTYTSFDGLNWSFVSSLPSSVTTSAAYSSYSHGIYANGKIYLIDGKAANILETSDLINWTNHVLSAFSGNWRYPNLGYANGVLVMFYVNDSSQYELRIVDTTAWALSSPKYTFTDGQTIGGVFNTTATIGTDLYVSMDNGVTGNVEVWKISPDPGQSYVSPPYSYAFTTVTPGLPLSWVGTSPGTYTKKMFIKNEEKAWTLTLGTPGVLTQVTDPDYPAKTVPGAVYLDGYFFVMDKDGTVYNCDLENPDSWNALNYITAEAEWDKGVAIAKHQNYVVALKDWTCELFYDAANPTGSPLSKVSNATVQIGCAQGYSTVQFHGGLIFMSKTRERGRSVHFFPPNSIDPQEIASASIQRILNAADLTTVRAWGGKLGGRILYVLNLVTANISLVYDFTSQTWAQWTSDNAGTEGYFKYGFYATDGNRDYLLHETTGEVFTLTPDVYHDNGADIKVLIRTGRLDAGNMDRKTMSQLTIVGDKAATSVSVQQSDDDYQTFSTARTVAMDAEPPRLLRLGMFRRRSFDIRHVDNTPLRLTAIDAEIQQAR